MAYPGVVPPAVQARLAFLESMAGMGSIPEECFEVMPESQAGGANCRGFALRLGQPTYPHMKLVIEACPRGGVLFRADAHDAHLHAPAGSPDEAPLAALRARNKQLTEQIEVAWMAAGLPTFRGFLREELARRRGKVGG